MSGFVSHDMGGGKEGSNAFHAWISLLCYHAQSMANVSPLISAIVPGDFLFTSLLLIRCLTWELAALPRYRVAEGRGSSAQAARWWGRTDQGSLWGEGELGVELFTFPTSHIFNYCYFSFKYSGKQFNPYTCYIAGVKNLSAFVSLIWDVVHWARNHTPITVGKTTKII